MQNEFDPQSTERLAQIIAEVLAGRLPRREVLRRCLALGLGLPAAGVVLAACGLEQTADEAGRISDWRPPAAPAASPAPLRATLQPVGQSSPETLPATPETLPAPAVRGAQIRVAVIGDYGMEGEPAAAVGALVSGWAPDAVLTLGDNNYPRWRSRHNRRECRALLQRFYCALQWRIRRRRSRESLFSGAWQP
ncbi:MAG: hypothetical protein HC822_20915 [Oscillochloris sp.]|nr:hypothetical protein [Oscillochloris sp.]